MNLVKLVSSLQIHNKGGIAMPNALLVYPEFPLSYWGMQYAVEFVGKKSTMPPLGLLTIAGMFPKDYKLRFVDMNVSPLTNDDLSWADVVFTSTMVVQQESLREVIARCNKMDVPIVAGGPYPTSFHDEIHGVNYFILGEVEGIFLRFLEIEGRKEFRGQGVYRNTGKRPDISEVVLPRFDLINFDDYDTMPLQWSRGCPGNCEFCNITFLYGRKPRTKSIEQMLAEFQLLYDLGWRGEVFLVDDNFIGNKHATMRLLSALVKWQRDRGNPFDLHTEAGINLAEEDDLMSAMVDAGFYMVFLGIETPNQAALIKTGKFQNVKNGDDNYLLHAVRKIQSKGLQVSGGFILGLDGDDETVFDAQIELIQDAGIPISMVGLLGAMRGTRLYERLLAEGRLLSESLGNNVSLTLNFKPEMDSEVLLNGYKYVHLTIYDPSLRNYFQRVLTMFGNLGPNRRRSVRIRKAELLAFAKSINRQLFSKKQGFAYFLFLVEVLIRYPRMFADAVRLAIMGYHFERITHELILKGKCE